MGELRKDYILDEYVIIATERSKRPDQFAHKDLPNEVKFCPFCPGSEDKTPPELLRFDKDGNWQVRVFENKFAAARQEGNPSITTHDNFFTFSSNYGKHEVVVETPSHTNRIWDLDHENTMNIFRAYQARVKAIREDPLIRYVEIFKNSGKEAATSVAHSHSQIIGLSKFPKRILDKEKATTHYNSCPYCDIIEIEMKSDRRVIENDTFVAFTPYGSRYNFEIWIFPKRHLVHLLELDEKEISDICDIYQQILGRLKTINAPFNMCVQSGIEKMHFHVEIKPRLSKWGGWELGTNNIINIVSPEQAARFYRGEE